MGTLGSAAGGNAMDMVIGAGEVAKDAASAREHFDKAMELELEGEYQPAIDELRISVRADATNLDAAFKLAYLLDLVGEDEEALSLYEQVCEASPAPVNALLNLAVMYEDRNDYVRAERSVRQVLDTNPTHPRARLYMKDIQASRGMVIEEDTERDSLKRKALLDTPVTDFELSVRARTCLKKMNIRTLGDLLRITEAELMSYKNFGESSLIEIKKMLSAKNLKLGQGLEDAHRSARRQVLESLKGTGKEAMLNKPVSDLQLSVRARKALQLLNIHSLGDLVSHTEAELMGVKNFGATSLVEVREKLVDYGLSLRLLEEGEEPIGGLPASLPMDMSADFGVDMPPMIGGTLGGPAEPQDAQPEVGEGIPSVEDEAVTAEAVESVVDEASVPEPTAPAAPAAEEASIIEPAPAEGETTEPDGDAPKTLG